MNLRLENVGGEMIIYEVYILSWRFYIIEDLIKVSRYEYYLMWFIMRLN